MIPMGGNKISLNPRVVEEFPDAYIPMGNTAENVARQFNVSRGDQDAFALASHQKAAAAWARGDFAAEVVPVKTRVFDGDSLARRHRRQGRGPARRHDAREARVAQARLRSDGHGHGRQRVAAQRRRRGRRAHGRRRGAQAGQEGARLLPRVRRRGRAARHHGHRPRARRAQAAREDRAHDRPDRSLRGQRGLRVAGAVLPARARRCRSTASTSTAAPSRSATRSAARARARSRRRCTSSSAARAATPSSRCASAAAWAPPASSSARRSRAGAPRALRLSLGPSTPSRAAARCRFAPGCLLALANASNAVACRPGRSRRRGRTADAAESCARRGAGLWARLASSCATRRSALRRSSVARARRRDRSSPASGGRHGASCARATVVRLALVLVPAALRRLLRRSPGLSSCSRASARRSARTPQSTPRRSRSFTSFGLDAVLRSSVYGASAGGLVDVLLAARSKIGAQHASSRISLGARSWRLVRPWSRSWRASKLPSRAPGRPDARGRLCGDARRCRPRRAMDSTFVVAWRW